MGKIEEMRQRHQREIETLQRNCKHEEVSEWMPEQWAPGHFCGYVRVCMNCSKVIERATMTTSGPSKPEKEGETGKSVKISTNNETYVIATNDQEGETGEIHK